jgi:hypothetical protein
MSILNKRPLHLTAARSVQEALSKRKAAEKAAAKKEDSRSTARKKVGGLMSIEGISDFRIFENESSAALGRAGGARKFAHVTLETYCKAKR